MSTLHLANGFFENSKPWLLRKDPKKVDELNAVLHVTMETLRICGILLQPLVPKLSGHLLNKIKVNSAERTFRDSCRRSFDSDDFESRILSDENVVLFRRIIPVDKIGKGRKVSERSQ